MAALFAARKIASVLFGVQPADGLTFGGIAVLMLAVALLASLIPARRAAGTAPLKALRYK